MALPLPVPSPPSPGSHPTAPVRAGRRPSFRPVGAGRRARAGPLPWPFPGVVPRECGVMALSPAMGDDPVVFDKGDVLQAQAAPAPRGPVQQRRVPAVDGADRPPRRGRRWRAAGRRARRRQQREPRRHARRTGDGGEQVALRRAGHPASAWARRVAVDLRRGDLLPVTPKPASATPRAGPTATPEPAPARQDQLLRCTGLTRDPQAPQTAIMDGSAGGGSGSEVGRQGYGGRVVARCLLRRFVCVDNHQVGRRA